MVGAQYILYLYYFIKSDEDFMQRFWCIILEIWFGFLLPIEGDVIQKCTEMLQQDVIKFLSSWWKCLFDIKVHSNSCQYNCWSLLPIYYFWLVLAFYFHFLFYSIVLQFIRKVWLLALWLHIVTFAFLLMPCNWSSLSLSLPITLDHATKFLVLSKV